MKIIAALFLFVSAAIAVYHNRAIRSYIASRIQNYKSGIDSMIRTSITGIKSSVIIRLECLTVVIIAFLVFLTGQWMFAVFGVPVMFAIPSMYAAAERKKYINRYLQNLKEKF